MVVLLAGECESTSVKGAFAMAEARRDEMREDLAGESGNGVCMADAKSRRKSSSARRSISCVFLGEKYQFV